VTIVLIVEGETEAAVRPVLKAFLDERCEAEGKPKVRLDPKRLRAMRNETKLRAVARDALKDSDVCCLVGLVDVYPDFADASDAKRHLRSGLPEDPRCHAHAAQYEFEAWLLPFWDDICRNLRLQAQRPGGDPEEVDLTKPPSHRLKELYRKAGFDYHKPRDALAILSRNKLGVAAHQCPELKALLETLLKCAGLPPTL